MKKYTLWLIATLLYLPCLAEEISAELGKEKVKNGAILVDVRSPEEYAEGHVEGAKNIPIDSLPGSLSKFGENKDQEIVLYCRSGRRSGMVEKILEKNGYKFVYNSGGLADWQK